MYDIISYYDKMLKNYSATASEICRIRWDWVKEANARTVLDYGSGVGFFRAFRPQGVEVDNYDVMPVPQTGVTRKSYDLLSLWDVLEHMDGLTALEPFLSTCQWVAISIPILPKDRHWIGWKHFKPSEHLFYPSADQLAALFQAYNYEEVKRGQPECPPREDVWNFLYRKTQKASGAKQGNTTFVTEASTGTTSTTVSAPAMTFHIGLDDA